MNIPEGVLDQAARDAYAAYYGEQPDEWEKVWRNEDRVDWVNVARAALSAAAPYLMAMALREAADDIDIGQDTANHHETVAAETWLLDRANELEAL